MEGKWTVYYDGYCNLCSRAVQWIVRNDRAGKFMLIPLQAGKESEWAMGQLRENLRAGEPDTVLLLRDGKLHARSTAILLIASRLRFPWPLVSSLMIIPRFLRDPVYSLIARNRKRWFGERSTCYIPPGSSDGTDSPGNIRG